MADAIVTGAMVRAILQTLRYEHDAIAKRGNFWQRFFGDDVAFSLEHIANRSDVCDEIARYLNISKEWARFGEFKERSEDDPA